MLVVPCQPSKLTEDQKDDIMAEVLGQMVKATFETHMYEWDGNTYSQTEGCPTGLRVSGPISRMTMEKWVIELQKIEELSKALTMINPINTPL